jgi:chromosome segregation ATPase
MRGPASLVIDAVRLPGGVAQTLAQLPQTIGDRLSALDHGLQEILALLPAAVADLASVRAIVEKQDARVQVAVERVAAIEQIADRLETQMSDVQQRVARVQGILETALERLPDPDAPGPLARARDALTGG